MTKIKLLLASIMMSLVFLLSAQVVAAAAGDLSVRLVQPKSPINLNDFYITFVALDIADRPISVVCQKQFEGGAVTSFDTTKTLSAGGNTDTCHITSAVFNTKGNYTLSVVATADSDTATDSVTVNFNDEAPGDPRNYHKSKIESCKYEIKFTSNDDGGKTSKIEVYRSTDTSFTADSGTRIIEESIGSNTDRTITDTVPDCNKTYYYALRAFSAAGTGSGVVGDQEVKTVNGTTQTSTTTPARQGAIPMTRTGSVLGASEEPSTAPATEAGRVLGEQADIEGEATSSADTTNSTAPNLFRAVAIALGLFILITLFRRSRAR